MSFNIELKARCQNPDHLRKKVLQLPHKSEGRRQQIDTFFVTPKGRLKLRESSPGGCTLIPYLRDDITGPKRSDYSLFPVDEPESSKRILTKMFGVLIVVKKIREVYLFENVRIHLDYVEKLGTFVEFEAVVHDQKQVPANQKKLEWLIHYFDLKQEQFVPKAYADLLLSANSE